MIGKKFHLFSVYSLLSKVVPFALTAFLAKLQHMHSDDAVIAYFAFYLQWIVLSSLIDLGFTNWISIAKNPKVSSKLVNRFGFISAILVGVVFTGYYACSTYNALRPFVFAIVFSDVVFSYLVNAKIITYVKSSNYRDGLMLQIVGSGGPIAYLFLCLQFGFRFQIVEILFVSLFCKTICVAALCGPFNFAFNVRLVLSFFRNCRFTLRYFVIQVCSFAQFGSEQLLGFYLFDVADFNVYSSTVRVLQSSMLFSGIATSYFVNFSGDKFQKHQILLLILFSVLIQTIFCTFYAAFVGVSVGYAGLLYIALIAVISFWQTRLTIENSALIARFYLIGTLPVVFFKAVLIGEFRILGLLFTSIIQILFLVFFVFLNNRRSSANVQL